MSIIIMCCTTYTNSQYLVLDQSDRGWIFASSKTGFVLIRWFSFLLLGTEKYIPYRFELAPPLRVPFINFKTNFLFIGTYIILNLFPKLMGIYV
jgi:hypothetical protein